MTTLTTADSDCPADASPASRPHYERRAVDHCLCCGSPDRNQLFLFQGYHLQRCIHCDLAYISDPPTPADLQRFYSFAAGYHSEFASSPAARDRYLQRGHEYLRYLTPHVRTGRLLDVGCSAGFFLKAARQKGWTVQGLEFSPDSAELGRELHDVAIDIGDLSTQTYPSESFEAVTLWDVIEHLPDPLPAMQRAFDLLVPGGYVALSTPNIDGLFPRLSYFPGKLLNYWPHPAPPAHLCQFSTRTLSRLLQRAGFEVVRAHSRRIPMDYSFGRLRDLLRMPKRLAYAAAFAPVAFIAPWFGLGDEVVMIARKR